MPNLEKTQNKQEDAQKIKRLSPLDIFTKDASTRERVVSVFSRDSAATWSIKELVEELNLPLATVGYHVRQLKLRGLLIQVAGDRYMVDPYLRGRLRRGKNKT